MPDVFPIYEALWSHVEALGAVVLYDGFLADGAGTFHPNPGELGHPSPTIRIGRPFYERIDRPTRSRNAGGKNRLPPDLLRETATLAHEAGHFLSWQERTPRDAWGRYFAAAIRRDGAWGSVSRDGSTSDYNARLRTAARAVLTDDDVSLILHEEELAWSIGRELLERLHFTDLDFYADLTRRGLHYYRYRLGLEDLWDEDLRQASQTT